MVAELLLGGDLEVPLLALLAGGCDAAGPVGVQHGGAPLQAAQGHSRRRRRRAQAEAVRQLEPSRRLVALGSLLTWRRGTWRRGCIRR